MKEERMTAQKVVRNYLFLSGIYTLSASLIWGVNTLFLLDSGLDIFEVFLANSVFTGSMALFEIPTGVLADTRGRRASFLLSITVLFIGTMGYVGASFLGGGIVLFSIMSVVLGIGYTFYSGAMEAWLVDALKATGYDGQLDRVFARGSFVTGGAMLIGTVSGGFLGNLDLTLPYLARAALLLVAFGVATASMHDLGFQRRKVRFSVLPAEMKAIARACITYGWQRTSVRLLVISSLFSFSFLSWAFYAWQPYFLRLLGQDLIWISGVIAALVSLSTMAGNSLVEWLTRYCGKRTTLLMIAMGVQVAAAIGVGLTSQFWVAVPLFLLMMAATGVFGPVKQAYIHQVIPSEHRATIVSFDSLVGSAGSVGGQSGLGYLSRARSISTGFVVGGAVTSLVLPTLFLLRRLGEMADRISGAAGKRGACAAQGLPEVATVDTASRHS
jgi:MFS family permease